MNSSSVLLRKGGICFWISFLMAGVATMLFFATFDPTSLGKLATFPIELSREAGYTVGFFLFWTLLSCNSVVVLYLASPTTRHQIMDCHTAD